MKTLSTGHPSTLGNWRLLASTFFGEGSKPVIYLDEKIKDQGEEEEVIADEGQMIQLLASMM